MSIPNEMQEEFCKCGCDIGNCDTCFICEGCDKSIEEHYMNARHDCGCKLMCDSCCEIHDKECEEYKNQKNEEIEKSCPICFEKYGQQEDGSFRCKDSIDNSNHENVSNCKHYICVPCCQTLYDRSTGSIACPICRADWTEWITDSYRDEEEEKQKELWIDLQSLIQCSTRENGYVIIYNQYDKDHPCPVTDTFTYQLRIALRALGYKITKWIRYMDGWDIKMIEYKTNIPEAVYEKNNYWNKWIDEVCEESY
jgi:hypothetical protein